MNAPITSAAPADPLAGLRGYRMPEPISWWPPAPGWWALVVVIILILAALVWWRVRRRRRRAAAYQATRELTRLHAAWAEGGDAATFVRDLSKLLRRFALAAYPRREVAALTGEDWLRFLDRHGGDGQFHDGPGRVLAEAPYRRAAALDPAPLAALVAEWIRCNREVRA